MAGYNFKSEKAVRDQICAKIALMGPSGSGKSYSALRVATGIKEQIEKKEGRPARILLGNTELSRGKYYANEFEYEITNLSAPFEPEMYVGFIQYAIDEGFDILIIDGTSPEWEGEGGCLELHAQAGGKYQDWAKISPRHLKFIEAIANAPIHIIATMRGKDQYEVDRDDRGKVNVRKLGVGAKQREGFEYEFTATFLLDSPTNLSTPQKDNTHLFEGKAAKKLTEADGRAIYDWANSGEAKKTEVKKFKPADEDDEPSGKPATDEAELSHVIDEIDSLAKSLSELDTIDKRSIADAVRQHHSVSGKASANYHTINDVDIAKAVLKELVVIKDNAIAQ